MTFFRLTETTGQLRTAIVEADHAGAAQYHADAHFREQFPPGGCGPWCLSTIEELTEAPPGVTPGGSPDWAGWRHRVEVYQPAGGLLLAREYVAQTGDDIDDVGEALACLFNASGYVQGASWDGAQKWLTVAKGGGVDDLGDHLIAVYAYPPGSPTNDSGVALGVPVGGGGPEYAQDDLQYYLAPSVEIIPRVVAL